MYSNEVNLIRILKLTEHCKRSSHGSNVRTPDLESDSNNKLNMFEMVKMRYQYGNNESLFVVTYSGHVLEYIIAKRRIYHDTFTMYHGTFSH